MWSIGTVNSLSGMFGIDEFCESLKRSRDAAPSSSRSVEGLPIGSSSSLVSQRSLPLPQSGRADSLVVQHPELEPVAVQPARFGPTSARVPVGPQAGGELLAVPAPQVRQDAGGVLTQRVRLARPVVLDLDDLQEPLADAYRADVQAEQQLGGVVADQ